jgi:tetraacyldisaccharide 4'-kinase
LTSRLESHWQAITAVSMLLYPLSLAFRVVAGLRRLAYRSGLLRSVRLPVPVIVIGNITTGGTGKTPLTLWLAEFLRERGRVPGILCRGYGGTRTHAQRVAPDSDPLQCGDEAVLLAQRSGCEVWIGADRPAAARALLAAHPDCDVLISDDGLQHYALARDVEICLVDAVRGLGNGWMLPAGPLREPPSRLASVDAIVVSHEPAAVPGSDILQWGTLLCAMHLEPIRFRNVAEPGLEVGLDHFRGKRVHAMAGIGHPERFFDALRRLGLEPITHPFPDHHAYSATDLSWAGTDPVVMTEKDAVKCHRFKCATHWALSVDAVPDLRLARMVLDRLGLDN